jgi:hypothetical protein
MMSKIAGYYVSVPDPKRIKGRFIDIDDKEEAEKVREELSYKSEYPNAVQIFKSWNHHTDDRSWWGLRL